MVGLDAYYLFAKAGAEIAYPTDVLFVEKDICEWRIFDELAIAAYWTGHYVESKNSVKSYWLCRWRLMMRNVFEKICSLR